MSPCSPLAFKVSPSITYALFYRWARHCADTTSITQELSLHLEDSTALVKEALSLSLPAWSHNGVAQPGLLSERSTDRRRSCITPLHHIRVPSRLSHQILRSYWTRYAGCGCFGRHTQKPQEDAISGEMKAPDRNTSRLWYHYGNAEDCRSCSTGCMRVEHLCHASTS